MPVEHPLLFFGPWDALEGTGEDIVYPLFRDQGNSAYVRDTVTRPRLRGSARVGLLRALRARIVEAKDISEPEDARMSPS
ncbi:MAG: hypothetical protein CM15mP84_00210 [Cellvibrionales bacterium]|nr:MAG: hypothetical protein CM15mP84_00210 [Cellvibrionales bacterium]